MNICGDDHLGIKLRDNKSHELYIRARSFIYDLKGWQACSIIIWNGAWTRPVTVPL